METKQRKNLIVVITGLLIILLLIVGEIIYNKNTWDINDYADVFQKDYLTECTKNNSYQYCKCSFDYMIKEYGLKKMLDEETRMRNGEENNVLDFISNASLNCTN